MTGQAIVLRGDARRLPLPNASVDLVISSPPFLNLRSYQDDGTHYESQIGTGTRTQWLEDLWVVMLEVKRVMKPTASAFIELGDSYENKCLNLSPHRFAIGCTDKLGFMLRAEIIWDRPNGLPESVTDRVRRSHSCWFHFVREPKYFAAVDEVRESHTGLPVEHYGRLKQGVTSRTDGVSREQTWIAAGEREYNPLGKLPGSVWTIPSEPLLIPEWAKDKYNLPDHFAAFPQEWPRRLILGWSPSGVCEECGEIRKPVLEKRREKSPVHGDGSIIGSRRSPGDIRGWDGLPRFNMSREITGYACRCTEIDKSVAELASREGSREVLRKVGVPETRPAVVLDPFGGTGTTAMVARALGRDAISLDLSMDYSRLAQWRIHKSNHGAKALGRTWRERQGTL